MFPLRYLHGVAVAASTTIRSAPKLLSYPNEYDRFSVKLNRSSVVLESSTVVISLSESILFMITLSSIPSKLGRIRAAIKGMNGDSGRKIPARQRGQLA